MFYIVAPLATEADQHTLQHIEVVNLLITNDINQFFWVVFVIAQLRRAKVLGHVNRSAIAAEQQLLVQALIAKVAPYGVVVATIEHAFFEAFLHQGFAQEVGLGFIIYLLEGHAKTLVGHIEAIIHPLVHRLPEMTHLGVVGLPFH